MAEFKDRLNQALEEKEMSPAELSRISGVNEGAISQYRKGAYKAGQRSIEKIASALNVSIPWLMGAEVPVPAFLEPVHDNRFVPIIGSVRCGPNGLAFQYLDGGVSVDDSFAGNIVAFHCKGDSMKDLGIADGDTAIVRLQEEVENGELAVVTINGDEGTLKRVRLFEGGLILEAANINYEPRIFTGEQLNQIRIVGKVLEVRKRF